MDEGAGLPRARTGRVPPSTCGSRPPTRSLTCSMTGYAPMRPGPASIVIQDYCDVGVSGRREGRPQLNALMAAARNHEIDCVLVWKFDRFARSTRHLLAALEEFNHLGVRFVSVQDQIDTDSPMGRAMFTIIGAMAELKSSLISERVTAGMRAAETRGKHLGRPATPQRVITEIETLATSTTSAFGRFRAKSLARQAADWSARSLNAPATPRRRRCDNFLHVCSGYPCHVY